MNTDQEKCFMDSIEEGDKILELSGESDGAAPLASAYYIRAQAQAMAAIAETLNGILIAINNHP